MSDILKTYEHYLLTVDLHPQQELTAAILTLADVVAKKKKPAKRKKQEDFSFSYSPED